ncbi:MAG TPA: carboxypeptidase-like regulatory domain-containing protein, partial [Algoriphagus sp.]|nr:carboxypeptidase-like regulatory domain-containing protein [Algoriphagus sp.]
MKKYLLNHVIRMTRLFLVAFSLQCLTMSLLMAWDGKAQVKKIEEVSVNISMEQVKIEKVFTELEDQTKFNFVFSKRELKDVPLVDIISNGESLYQNLLNLARQSNLSFKQVNSNIHVKKSDISIKKALVSSVFLEEINIVGRVVDQSGLPLPGATITIEGTNSGTVSDDEGNFSLDVPDGGVLLVSFIGFTTQRIPL